jgi:hypothetical protein
MRKTIGVTVALICLWGFPSLAAAQKVTVSSSTQGVRLTTELEKPVRVTMGSFYPVAAIWVMEITRPENGSDPCPTAMTNLTKSGILLYRYAGMGTDKSFHEFRPLAGWSGGNAVLCAILDGGDDPVDLYISHY